MASDKIWIACIPTRAGTKPEAAIAADRCRLCGCKIWIAASTVEIVLCRADLAMPVCIPCWVTHMKEHPNDWKDFTLHTTANQQAEVHSYIGMSVDEVMAQFGLATEMLDPKGRS